MFTRKTNNQNNSYKSAQFILEKSQKYLLFQNKDVLLHTRLGGVWSLVRIQSPRLVKEVRNRMGSNLFLF